MPLCRPAPLLSIPLLSIPAPGRPLGEEVAVWQWRGHGCQRALPAVGHSDGWVGGWFACFQGGCLTVGTDRSAASPPALLSFEDWFRALASAHRGHFHQKPFSGLYDMYWWSALFPGTRVSIAAVMGAQWHVAAPRAWRWDEGALEAELLSHCC